MSKFAPELQSWDVIVVGGGGSGMMTAVEASRRGLKCLVIEKQHRIGGTTAISVGSLSANCTPQQRRAGINDSPQDHFEDLAKFAGVDAERDNVDLRWLYVRQISDVVETLMQYGVQFYGPLPEPPHRVPRLHTVIPNSRSYLSRLHSEFRRHDGNLLTGWRVEELILDRNQIKGVRAKAPDGRVLTLSSDYVVLATGDFSSSRELKSRYLGGDAADTPGVNPGSEGDGHRMATALGGDIVNGDIALGPQLRFAPPRLAQALSTLPTSKTAARLMRFGFESLPERLRSFVMMYLLTTHLAPAAGLVEASAVLRGNEPSTSSPLNGPLVASDDRVWLLFDTVVGESFEAWPHFVSTAPGIAYAYLSDYRRYRRDVCHVQQKSSALSRQIGVSSELVDSVLEDWADKLGRRLVPPFYALGPLRSWMVLSDGGLAVSSELQVLGKAGAPIGGLYAVGSVGQGGLVIRGHGHHIGWAFVSGMTVGRRIGA